MTPLEEADMTYQRVEVFWRDSMSQGGWAKPDELLAEIKADGYLDCSSVGYLLDRSDTALTLVQNRNPHAVGEAMTIPLEAVKDVRSLTEEKT